MRVTASVLALGVDADGPLCGIALIGPSGSGKSALALASVTGCPYGRSRLVGDDAVELTVRDGALMASGLAPMAEARGVGLVRVQALRAVKTRFAFEMIDAPERLPSPRRWEPLGPATSVPLFYRPPPGALVAVVRSLLSGHCPESWLE